MRSFVVILTAVAMTACSKQNSATTDSSKAAAATAPSKIGEAAAMKTPESVRYDQELDVFFVSNINGNPSQHDNNGFISVIRADSIGAAARVLVEGGKNGAKLDAPKGMAIIGDTLWVADINHMRGFNRRTGAPVADIDLSKKAEFLNDVAVGGPDGALWATDTGIRFDASGAMTHPGKDQLFKLVGRNWIVAPVDSLNGPNGITWNQRTGRWLLAPFNGTEVQSWVEGEKVPIRLASGPGQYDGIEVLPDLRVLVSSWADSAVLVVHGGKLQKLIDNVSAPADIGYDVKRGVLAIPRFNDGKVDFYKIP